MERVRRSQIGRRLNRLVPCRSSPSRAGSDILRRAGGARIHNLRLYLVYPVGLERSDHVGQLVAVVEHSEPRVEHGLRRNSIADRQARSKIMVFRKIVLRLIADAIAD